LTVYTPTHRRPKLLANCCASVQAQTNEVQHLIVRDEVGIGIKGVFADIPNHASEVKGEYVLVLSDDNELVGEDFAEELRDFALKHDWPKVIVFKLDLVGRLLPNGSSWGREPQIGYIDLSSFVVRRDVWVRHAGDWGKRYEGDYDFIRRLWDEYEFAWWDRLGVRALQIGRGRPEG
jgi:GT2 family glycosyltransferase